MHSSSVTGTLERDRERKKNRERVITEKAKTKKER